MIAIKSIQIKKITQLSNKLGAKDQHKTTQLSFTMQRTLQVFATNKNNSKRGTWSSKFNVIVLIVSKL